MIAGLLARFLAPVLAVLLVLALALAGWHSHKATKISAEFDAYRATAERQAREQSEAARAAETATRSKQSEAQDDAILSLKLAHDDSRRADAAGVRLHKRAAALAAASCAAPHPGAAASSPPADTASDLLADMLKRVDDAAGTIARYADAARIAGQLCERSYEALSPP